MNGNTQHRHQQTSPSQAALFIEITISQDYCDNEDPLIVTKRNAPVIRTFLG